MDGAVGSSPGPARSPRPRGSWVRNPDSAGSKDVASRHPAIQLQSTAQLIAGADVNLFFFFFLYLFCLDFVNVILYMGALFSLYVTLTFIECFNLGTGSLAHIYPF